MLVTLLGVGGVVGLIVREDNYSVINLPRRWFPRQWACALPKLS